MLFDNSAIHDARFHPDHAFVFERTGVNEGKMTDRYIRADGCPGGAVARYMNDGAILNIRSPPYVYRSHIAAHHGSVPNAGMI